MTDRLESAEKLLATIQAGQAHVRALAIHHLPPGRAFALDMHVLVGRSMPTVARPAPPVVAPVPDTPAAAPVVEAPVVEAPEVEAPVVEALVVEAPTIEPEVAAPPEPDPIEAEPEVAIPVLVEPAVVAAEPVSPAPEVDEPVLEDSQPVDVPEEYDESTQIIAMDDELRAAIASARGGEVFQASDPTLAQPLDIDDDEDTSDEDTDPGTLAADGPSQSWHAQPLDPTDDLPAEETAEADPAVVTESQPDVAEVIEEESGSLEHTLLQGADIFGAHLDPTAGWEVDDEDSIVDEGVVGGLSWGDDDPNDRSGSFEDTLAPRPAVLADTLVEEPDDERTRIGAPDAALLEAIQAADTPAQEDPEDDFALSAHQLHWGDAHGDTRHEAVSVPASEVSEGPDQLHWGDDASADWAVSDPSQPAADPLSEEADARYPLASPEELDDADDVALPRVSSFADEHIEHAPTDAQLPEPEPEPEPDVAVPDVLEDDPLDRTHIHRPVLPVDEPAPTPVLAVPRVVEPRSNDSLEAHTGAAAIQILGVGMAQTLTPTLELGEAPDEDDTAATPVMEAPREGDDGFSLQFEEPEEASTGPHIPVLTEDVATPHQPAMLSPDGVIVPSTSRANQTSLAASEAERFLEQARAAERKGNLRDAVVHYDDLLSHDPHNLSGHLGRGRCLVDLGDYGSAMSDFTRAEDIAPDSPEPLVEMGNLFFARKEYKRAITYYNHAIDLDNRHAMAFSRRGISHYHRRMFAEAHNDLTEAEKRDPSIPGLQRYIQMTSRKLKKRR